MSMFDAQCPKCRKRFGWSGEVRDRPPCPRCGHEIPAAELEADAAKIEEMFALMRTHPRDADGQTLKRMRLLAGLGLRQAAIQLGIEPPSRMCAIEQGEETLREDEAVRMSELYCCGLTYAQPHK